MTTIGKLGYWVIASFLLVHFTSAAADVNLDITRRFRQVVVPKGILSPDKSCAGLLAPQVSDGIHPDIGGPHDQISAAIKSFYDLNDSRFRDEFFKRRIEPHGERLSGEKQIFVSTDEGEFLAFHRMSPKLGTRELGGEFGLVTYAGLLGTSIVTIKRISSAQDHNERDVQQLKYIPQLLKSHGIKAASYMGEIQESSQGRRYLIFEYVPGATYSQLEDMARKGQLDHDIWERAQSRYEVLAQRINRLNRSSALKQFAEKHNTFTNIVIDKADVIYSNGEWVIVRP